MWPSGLKGEVATQKSFWAVIQSICSGCKCSQNLTMVDLVQGGSLQPESRNAGSDESDFGQLNRTT